MNLLCGIFSGKISCIATKNTLVSCLEKYSVLLLKQISIPVGSKLVSLLLLLKHINIPVGGILYIYFPGDHTESKETSSQWAHKQAINN